MSGTPTARCPSCGAQFQVTRPELIGRTAPCPSCRQPFQVQPLPSTPTAASFQPAQPAANQFWVQGQAAAVSQGELNAKLVVAVTVIGSILLLALIGGAIAFSFAGRSGDPDEADSSNDSQIASGEQSPASEEKTHSKRKPGPSAASPSRDPGHRPSVPTSDDELQPDSPDAQYDDTSTYSNYDDRPSSEDDDPDYSNQSLSSDPVSGSARESPDARPSRASIRLSRGVALPQTLPTGTAIGFSATYEFTSGGPRSSSKYFWVITNRQRQTAPIPVRLNRAGQLNTFIGWRKHHGPFSCHIEAVTSNGERRTISSELSFR